MTNPTKVVHRNITNDLFFSKIKIQKQQNEKYIKKENMRHKTLFKLQDLWKNLDEDLPFCTKHIESDIYSILQDSNSEEYTSLKPFIRQWLNFRTTLLASEQDDDNRILKNLEQWLETNL